MSQETQSILATDIKEKELISPKNQKVIDIEVPIIKDEDVFLSQTDDGEGNEARVLEAKITKKIKEIDSIMEKGIDQEKDGLTQKGEDTGRINRIKGHMFDDTLYKNRADYENAKREMSEKSIDKLTNEIFNNSKERNIEKKVIMKSNNVSEIIDIDKNKKIEKQGSIIEEFAELLKNNKIDQIIIAGDNINISGNKAEIVTDTNKNLVEKDIKLHPDLDSLLALYLLNNFNKKSTEETFNEGSVISIVGKDGSGKDLIEKKEGLIVYIDTGGNWLKITEEGKTKTLYIDHHGVGKKEPTCGTKMMDEIMEKAGIMKDKPEWLDKLINFVSELDNLTYLEKKDSKGRKVFNETYFRNEWPNSLYALAEKKIPFETLIKLCESEKITDPSKPFTEEELNGEIGSIKIDKFTIKELCKQQKEEVENILNNGIKNSIKHNTAEGKNMESTRLGKIIYQDYYKNFGKVNVILDHLSFKATKAKNYDTYMAWNKKKNSFYINSNHPNLSKIVEELNKIDPGCAIDVRGVMVYGKILNLTEEQFLNTIDPKILKNVKIIDKETELTQKTNGDPENQKDNNKTEVVKIEKQVSREEAIEELKNEIARLIRERDAKIEAVREKYKNNIVTITKV